MESVTTGRTVFHVKASSVGMRNSTKRLLIFLLHRAINEAYLKYLNTTQSQSQCQRGLYFLLVLVKEQKFPV